MSGATKPPLAVAISGSPRSPSRSRTLAETALNLFAERGCETRLIDLASLPAEALLARAQSPEIDAAIAAVAEARVMIAATPTYRALYTGLLKCFFDLMPQAIWLVSSASVSRPASPVSMRSHPNTASVRSSPASMAWRWQCYTRGTMNSRMVSRRRNCVSGWRRLSQSWAISES
jgi:hypothetical protein